MRSLKVNWTADIDVFHVTLKICYFAWGIVSVLVYEFNRSRQNQYNTVSLTCVYYVLVGQCKTSQPSHCEVDMSSSTSEFVNLQICAANYFDNTRPFYRGKYQLRDECVTMLVLILFGALEVLLKCWLICSLDGRTVLGLVIQGGDLRSLYILVNHSCK